MAANEIEILGYKYRVRKMGIKKQWKVFSTIAKTIAPSMGAIKNPAKLMNMPKEEIKKQLNLTSMIDAIVNNFDEDKIFEVVEMLLSPCESIENRNSDVERALKGMGQLSADKIDYHFKDDDGMSRLILLASKCIHLNFEGTIKKLISSIEDTNSLPGSESRN